MLPLFVAAVFAGIDPGASLSIADWYPKGGNYVFVCEAEGFTPTGYDWDFGDGQKLYDVANSNVFHHYSHNGYYDVSCTPADGEGNYAIAHLGVDVDMAQAHVDIAPWFPQGMNYVFECNTPGFGFTPEFYDWDFGDGQKLYDVSNQNIWHTFGDSGEYMVSCTASDNYGNTVIGWRHVVVEGDE